MEFSPAEAILARILIRAFGGTLRSRLVEEEVVAREDGENEQAEARGFERELAEEIEEALLDLIDTYEHEVKGQRKKRQLHGNV